LGRKQQRRKHSQQEQATPNIPWWGIAATVIVLVLLVGGILIIRQLNSNTPTNTAYQNIDQLSCDSGEHNTYHVHAHLSIYIEGQPVQIPANIGIAGDQSCLYWMHTHATDGIIHIEAPEQHDYAFSTFLDVWKQFALLNYPPQMSETNGWQVYVDGKPYAGDWHNISLKSHTLITMAWNSPGVTPDTTYSWGSL
jgi:hypothetical protein